MRNSLFILVLMTAIDANGAILGQEIQEITYLSSADNSQQPAMFHVPKSDDAVPLVVALHSWSGDYTQETHKAIEQWCVDNRWAYIHPNFRGRNNRPEATGSELAVKDIVSAVEYAEKAAKIDRSSIYLVGTSGGGYAALLMAGRHPEIWAGVSAWVPIYDLKAWYHECEIAKRKYAKEIVASCGGVPGESEEVDRQYENRSPSKWLSNAKGVTLHLNAGIQDGHTGSVPISHSLLAFNAVASEKNRLSEKDIDLFVEKAKVPTHLQEVISDKSYGERQPLFRRISGTATVTIFDGGHELISSAAIAWIKDTEKSKKSGEHKLKE